MMRVRFLKDRFGITFDQYVALDDNLITTEQQSLSDIITDSIQSKNEDDNQEDDDDDDEPPTPPPPPPSRSAALDALSILRAYFTSSSNESDKFLRSINKLESKIIQTTSDKLRQTVLQDFFN